MSELQGSPEPQRLLDRRGVLRLMAAAPVGAAVGAMVEPPIAGVEVVYTSLAPDDLPAGNASLDDTIDTVCANSPDPDCPAKLVESPGLRAGSLVTSPIEEMLFRGLPSAALDAVSGDNPTRTLLAGTGDRFGLSRREAIVGSLGSIVFAGGAHNYDFARNRLRSTHRLPIGQLVGGMAMWWLQRRMGMASNIAAHTTYNVFWLQRQARRLRSGSQIVR